MGVVLPPAMGWAGRWWGGDDGEEVDVLCGAGLAQVDADVALNVGVPDPAGHGGVVPTGMSCWQLSQTLTPVCVEQVGQVS
ncbi:hypothetical protein D3C59_29915 [Streptomyces sp. SHP22-7]|nr:hypothetical protein D3C59_29915 [Streptomyces sp. SHP22-7]